MANRKSLNTIAKKSNLELIKGNGYFYWWGLNEETQLKCAGAETTTVYINSFKDLRYSRWLDELELIKKTLEID